jgi:hypothetical protein
VSATLETVIDSAQKLDLRDQGKLVGILLEGLSEGLASVPDEALEEIADIREREMDENPEMVISHDEMLAHIESRRSS